MVAAVRQCVEGRENPEKCGKRSRPLQLFSALGLGKGLQSSCGGVRDKPVRVRVKHQALGLTEFHGKTL